MLQFRSPLLLCGRMAEMRTEAHGLRSAMLLQQERAGVKIAVDADETRAVLRADSNN